jgi:hypothetical protein
MKEKEDLKNEMPSLWFESFAELKLYSVTRAPIALQPSACDLEFALTEHRYPA